MELRLKQCFSSKINSQINWSANMLFYKFLVFPKPQKWEKESLECDTGIHLRTENLKVSIALSRVYFVHVTLLSYVANFRPENFPPPTSTHPHLRFTICHCSLLTNNSDYDTDFTETDLEDEAGLENGSGRFFQYWTLRRFVLSYPFAEKHQLSPTPPWLTLLLSHT